jgi:hypothetical protein
MLAQRYRLRFVTGISFSAATYGSSTYGGPITYGQRASDPVTGYRYRVVPLPAGSPTQPSWVRRDGDISPAFEAQIFDEIGPVDLSAVASATLVLTTNGVDPVQLPLEVVAPTEDGIVSHSWNGDDVVPVGTYRTTFVLTMTSGRRLSLPSDDNLSFVVTPAFDLSAP